MGPIFYYIPWEGGEVQKNVVYQNFTPQNNYI